MNVPLPTIAVLGASGLIGQTLAIRLRRTGFVVVPIARRFNAAQRAAFGENAVEAPLVELDAGELGVLLAKRHVDIVVNCIGALQDSARGTMEDVHDGFVARLVEALSQSADSRLLVHISVPGSAENDRTTFSTSKRNAERVIAASGVPHVILRPGFVVAPAAYGGSALIRALAALPFSLPETLRARPLAVTDIDDVARTIGLLADRWRDSEHDWHVTWDVMEREPSTTGGVVAAFSGHLGAQPFRLGLPSWLMDVGAKAGDFAAYLGWSPPIRSTALAEMRRGVDGDPKDWIAATSIEPASLPETLAGLPASVQDKWFSRLYLAKPLIIGILAVFWIVSGLIALTAAFDAATAILTDRGFPHGLAAGITIVSSLADILVGVAIAYRRSCGCGLLAGIGVSLFYMAGAAVLTPAMWVNPLGALIKTGPAIVLMLVALAILPER